MTRIEYKVETTPFHENEVIHRDEYLARLNELGKEGWRLVAMNPLRRDTGGWGPDRPIPMLLMREVAA